MIYFVFSPELENKVRSNYVCAKDGETVGKCVLFNKGDSNVMVFSSSRVTMDEALELVKKVDGLKFYVGGLPDEITKIEEL